MEINNQRHNESLRLNNNKVNFLYNTENKHILSILNDFILCYDKLGKKSTLENTVLRGFKNHFYNEFLNIINENDIEYFEILSKFNSIIYSIKELKSKRELSRVFWNKFNSSEDTDYTKLFKLFLDYRLIHLHKLVENTMLDNKILLCYNTSIYDYLKTIYKSEDIKIMKMY